MFDYSATVVKVIDGDTVDLSVDLGFHVSLTIRTRLIGIDAPEVSSPEGKITRDRLREALPVSSAVAVHTAKSPGDKYGRWLAAISGEMGDVAAWLLAQGLAQPYSGGTR